jgi:hypothetical protein
MSAFAISVFVSRTMLSKSFRMGENGDLEKAPGGILLNGTVETMTFQSMNEFAAMLGKLSPNTALGYGLNAHALARVVCQGNVQSTRESELPVIARTREHFFYAAAPGIMMIDVDAPKDGSATLTDDEVLGLLYAACPELRHAPHAITASASSHIYEGNKELIGGRGIHVYWLVTDARDIRRAGGVLFKRLWLAGQGRIELSRAGTMLVRGLIDASVWQPERLDFAGGAYCEPPLEQRRPAPVVHCADGEPLDTHQALPDLSLVDEGEYQKLVEQAKKCIQPQAEKARAEWVETQVERKLRGKGKTPESHPDEAKALSEVYTQAAGHGILYGDFDLLCEDGTTVSVREMLDDPSKWHGRRFADPLEPGYGNDRRIARANLRTAGRPYIYSHAHGGQRFGLQRARHRIRIVAGDRKQTVQKCLEVLRTERALYERGGEIVSVSPNADILPMDQDRLQLHLDGVARFEKYDKRSESWGPTDCPNPISKGVHVSRGHWALPNIRAVVTAPTLDPRTGRIIDQDGYDASSEILVVCNEIDDWPGVPTDPTQDQVRDAFNTLIHPFREFPCCDPTSWGVLIATVLTSMIRACLPTAPGTLFTSPVPGSGKTLLAKCVAALAGRGRSAMLPSSSSEEEVRKRLLAFGRVGHPVMILDNMSGEFESDALCAWLTAEEFSDRVLGLSEMVSISTQCILLLTGNNVQLRGDLCRRVLTCAIDPAMEEPWRRRFPFDPAEYCRENKLKMIAAGLTLLRAATRKGARPKDRTASFELWSDTVRATVLMIKDTGLFDVGDPVNSFSSAFALDDEHAMLERLLLVWSEAFNDAPQTVAEVIQHALAQVAENHRELFDSLYAVAGEQSGINARRFGKWLTKVERRERHGLRFERGKKRDGVGTWRVISTNSAGKVC